ncbi:MAG: SDR family NAD(P)-dependent oxidoreductase [Kofleriaceae bacterium]|nr:SDR family NAD(P)-dependent oxidoreductase [Kofleriaceae bacterium]
MTDLAKTFVVTGGTGALGTGVVELLLARGATVYLPIHEPALPAHLPWRTNARVKATPKVSLEDEAQVAAFYASVPDLWGSIHLVGGFAMAKLAETSLAEFEKQWRLNTVTCFLACREAVKAMRKAGNGGRIVNVGSRPVVSPTPGMISYVASKAGVAALTQSLAPELLAENILINAVLPSTIDTPANRAAMPKAEHDKWPKPAQIAETIAFLASPANVLTTGALVPVFGQA